MGTELGAHGKIKEMNSAYLWKLYDNQPQIAIMITQRLKVAFLKHK